ncbi:hypothetical protein KDA_75560 [Dictyobacter alpinus]|uniref:Uncharacterized protein n=1 Tax=Dictyobacter alpinus TaxID=2014873 RepID=A0A402BL65_9CHLR|nr:hypothetical protein [Dictyobacter alpinus]GCE32072.1 hypothetical protein KDA_75560 [Dictyobacter alpinus]
MSNHSSDTQSDLPKRKRSAKKAPSDDLLMASDAIKELGIPKSTFQRLVQAKKIPKVTPFGKTEGFYPKEFIMLLSSHLKGQTSYSEVAALLEKMTSKEPEQVGATDWIRPSDLPYVLALDYEVYGTADVVDMNITARWWEKNPYQCRILFDQSDRTKIWGVLTIMPLPLEIIYQLLEHKISERDISQDDIMLYESGKTYNGYIASAVVRPERRTYFRMLIQSFLAFFCDQYPSIQIAKFYAYASTDEGFDLMQQLLFSPRYDLGDNTFELDPMRRNRSRLVRSFQECIRKKMEGSQHTI